MAAGEDGERKLFIVVAWPIHLSATGTDGAYYKIYVYRKSIVEGTEGNEILFARAHNIENTLGSGFDGIREGAAVSFPYKDYLTIRAALAR